MTPLEKREIARRVGCHPNTVTRTLKMPEVQALIAELQQRAEAQAIKSLAERFDAMAPEAFEKLRDLVRGAKSETVQFKAMESVLDRSPSAPKRQIHSAPAGDRRPLLVIPITPELVQLAKAAIAEADAVDAEVTELDEGLDEARALPAWEPGALQRSTLG
jgi:histone H3/H4